MITEKIKAELSETAQEKLETIVSETVEKKIKKEIKKAVRSVTIKFVVAGVIIAGICYAVGNADKIKVLFKRG